MTLVHRLSSIVRWIFRRDRAEQELDQELQTYLELSAAARVRDGVEPSEARRLARLELGGVEQAKERVRTARHGAWLDEIGGDIRYGCRVLTKQRGFTALVVLTLALGIGANTAIFSLIDALLLRWLPVHNPQQLVQITFGMSGEDELSDSFSYAMVNALAKQDAIFDGVAGFSGNTFNVGRPGSITRTQGALVTGEFYVTLGLQPQIGRLLSRDDDLPGAPLVAVISDGYWERQFARSPTAVGQTIPISGVPVTIVGVSPRGFVGANVGAVAEITMPVGALVWVEPDAASLLGPGNFWLRVLARPAHGAGIAQAEARLAAAWRNVIEPVVAPHWPESRRRSVIDGVPHLSAGGTGWTYLRTIYVTPLLVLMGMVAVVLFIAAANVASLLLARATARQREIAVRLAIGAGRGRVIRQLLIESGLLSLIGATAGIGLAWLSGSFLVNLIAMGPGQMIFDLSPNWRVLAFTSAVAIATAFSLGVVPALHKTAMSPIDGLRHDTRAVAHRSRLLPMLVSAQVALSLVLLIGSALFVRTLQNLYRFDPGFQTEGVLLVDIEGRRTGVASDLVRELRQIPGVVSASVSTHTPLSGSRWSEPAVPAGQPIPENDNALFVGAGPRFFETMGIQVLSGREFTDRDSVESPGVAMVNERYAQQHFAGRNPVGQHLAATVRGRVSNLEIVGLVKNASATELRTRPPATVYVAYAQLTGGFPTTLEIRAAGSLGRVAAAIQETLRRRLPNMPVDVRPLSAQVEATMVRERMLATLTTGFGALAVILAAVGLYGLLAYRVTQRTKEIGIRMAVGAQRAQVVALVLKGATLLVVAGIVTGLPAALLAARWIESMLFGLTSTDPVTIGAAIVTLALVALAAAYVPAWRAARVDPLPALRHE
jgi:predicted permease